MALKKNELIAKLQEISELYSSAVLIRSKMDEFTPEDHYERKVPLLTFPGKYKTNEERDRLLKAIDHREDDAVAQMETAYKRIFQPRKPSTPQIKNFKEPEATSGEKEQASKYGCLATAGAAIGGLFALSVIATLGNGISFVPVAIAGIGTLLFVLGRNKKKKIKEDQLKRKDEALAAYNQEKAALLEDYKVKMQAYEEATEVYKGNLQQFLGDYSKWREAFLKRVQEEIDITQKLEEDREAGIQKIFEEEYLPAETALNEANTLVTDEYLPVLDIIVDLLKNGRADDLKEAINLYEDIVYRERQLALEREKEAQRQHEEQQRRQDEERRYREDMQFRKEQEWQRQREEEQRQKDAERRHREEMDQRERQERDRQLEARRRADEERRRADRSRWEQEQEQSKAASKQCQACAHVGRCNMRTYNNTPNCTGFTPR